LTLPGSPGDLGDERGGPGARRWGLGLGIVAFMFILGWPGLGLDTSQRAVAATTALTGILWITVALPIGATSLLPAVLFPLLGCCRPVTLLRSTCANW